MNFVKVIATVLAIALVGSVDSNVGNVVSAQQSFMNLKLNEVQHLGTHNSYHLLPDEELVTVSELFDVNVSGQAISSTLGWDYQHSPVSDQLRSPSFVKHLEFDLYYDESGLRYQNKTGLKLVGRPGVPMPEMQGPVFRTMHVADMDVNSNCYNLTECLNHVKDYQSETNGESDDMPLIVMLEYKATQTPDLMNLGFAEPYDGDLATVLRTELIPKLLSMFATNNIYKPTDLKGAEPTIAAGAAINGWPTLDALKGKVIFVLQGTQAKVAYKTSISGSVPASDDILFTLEDDCNPGNDYAAFVQISGGFEDDSQASKINTCLSQNMMLRVQADVNSYQARTGNLDRFDYAKNNGIQMISTDFLAEYPDMFGTNYGLAMAPKCNEQILGNTCDNFLPYAPQPTMPTVTQQFVDYPESSLADYTPFDPDQLLVGRNTTFLFNILDRWIEISGLNTTISPIPEFSPPTYTPASYVSSMHNVPRLYGDNEFTYEGDAGINYLIGIGIIIGVLFFTVTVLAIIACSYASCGCCASKKMAGQKIGSYQMLFIVVLLALLLISIGLFAYGVVSMDEAVDGYLSSSLNVENRLFNVIGFLESAKKSVANIGDSMQAISATCATLSSFSSLTSETNKFEDIAVDAINQLNDGENFVRSTREYLDKYSNIVVIVSYCVLGVFAFFLLCYTLFMVLRKKCPGKKVSRVFGMVLNPAIFIFILLFGLLFGAIFGLNIVISDVCTDPDQIIIDAVSDPLVNYYITCEGSNVMLDEAQTMLEQTHTFVDGEKLLSLTPGVCEPSEVSLAQSEMDVIIDEMINMFGSLRTLRDDELSCKSINPLYTQTVHETTCKDLELSTLFLWIGGVCIAFFGSVLLLAVGYQTRNYNKQWWDDEESKDEMGVIPSVDNYSRDDNLVMNRYDSEDNNYAASGENIKSASPSPTKKSSKNKNYNDNQALQGSRMAFMSGSNDDMNKSSV